MPSFLFCSSMNNFVLVQNNISLNKYLSVSENPSKSITAQLLKLRQTVLSHLYDCYLRNRHSLLSFLACGIAIKS